MEHMEVTSIPGSSCHTIVRDQERGQEKVAAALPFFLLLSAGTYSRTLWGTNMLSYSAQQPNQCTCSSVLWNFHHCFSKQHTTRHYYELLWIIISHVLSSEASQKLVIAVISYLFALISTLLNSTDQQKK